MKRNKLLGYLFLLIVIMGSFVACGKSVNNSEKDNGTNSSNTSDAVDYSLKGTITMAGSTSMEKLSRATVEVFMSKYPNITISPEFIGSSAGVEGVVNETLNIGNASRGLKDTEIAKGAVENVVALDGIAVIVDMNNSVKDLTKEQIAKIYTGQVNNWSEFGGDNQPIVVVGRESSSGTRGAFEELLDIEDISVYANEINSTGGVVAKVTSIPGAIGYVSLDVVTEDVVAIKVNGVEASEANIISGDYVLSRPFVMATLGDLSNQNEVVKAYFDFLKSPDGIEVIRSVGLIAVE